MRLEGDRLLDAPLQRAVRLGERDRQLAAALRQPQTFDALRARFGADIGARLTALARLYLLAGPRSRARLALESEKRRFLTVPLRPAAVALHWPDGIDPPRHGCVGTGTCCSASFLGPITPADRSRVAALSLGTLGDGERFESRLFHGKTVWGMARLASGQCALQTAELRCAVHAEHGAAAKPVPCRQFPLRFHRSPEGVHVSLLLACDGYDLARDAAQPWPQREAEVRDLLAAEASILALHLPVSLSAGLPVPFARWRLLRAACLAAEPAEPDPLAWLATVRALAAAAEAARAAELAEGPEIRWASALAVAGEDSATRLGSAAAAATAAAELREGAAQLAGAARPGDARRLRDLAAGLQHLEQPLPTQTRAGRQLQDIVANDLPAHVLLGELDVGLTSLAQRVRVAAGVATALALAANRREISAADTTRALHVVARSPAELAWLQGIGTPRGQEVVVAGSGTVP